MTEVGKRVATQEIAAAAVAGPNARRGVVFLQALRDNLTAVIAWGLGYSALIALVAFLYPILRESNTLLGVVRGLGLLGLSNNAINVESMTSFAGYLALEATGWAPLVLSVFLIPQALSVVVREEERGTLDILLSTPIPRWRFMVEKTLAIVVSLCGILAIMLLTLIVWSRLIEGIDLPLAHAVAGIWHILPISLTILAATLLISVAVRGTRAAGGWGALFVLASYFLRAVTDLLPDIPLVAIVRQFSIFGYYRPVAALYAGFQWHDDIVLLIAAVILFLLALWRFQRRDLGV